MVLDKMLSDDPNVPCDDDTTGLTKYLNRDDVRAALHIEPSLGKWQICSDFNYVTQYDDMVEPLHILGEKRKISFLR